MTAKTLSVNEIKSAYIGAKLRVSTEGYKQASGCGRVYINLTKSPRKGSKAFNAFTEATGLRLVKPYGCSGYAIYVGYDNATGYELKLGEVFKEELQKMGVECYLTAESD